MGLHQCLGPGQRTVGYGDVAHARLQQGAQHAGGGTTGAHQQHVAPGQWQTGVARDVGHQAQAVGVVGVDAVGRKHQGVGGARQLHAFAAVRGQGGGFDLEGHGNVAAAPAARDEVAHALGKAVDGQQAAFVHQVLAGQLGKTGVDGGRAAVRHRVAHHAIQVSGRTHGTRCEGVGGGQGALLSGAPLAAGDRRRLLLRGCGLRGWLRDWFRGSGHA